MIYSLSTFSKSYRLERNSSCKACRLLKNYSNNIDLKSDEDDYRTLRINSNSDQESVRKAFIALCKMYHPDSGSPESDTEKFQEIERAYRNLQLKFIKERWNVSDANNNFENKSMVPEAENFDIKHTAPQHRTYLSLEGVGSGTPFQRQSQYMQMRASKAAENISEHKMRNLEQKGNSLTSQDRRFINKAKTRFGMERLVEDLIQESMCKGDFDNLNGAGKPLKNKPDNPYVDFVTHKMNEIMIENGFTPEWITLRKEIDEDIMSLRKNIITAVANSKDFDTDVALRLKFEQATKSLNKKIELYNLTVPIMKYQKFLFNLEYEIKNMQTIKPCDVSQSVKSSKVESSMHSYDSIISILGSIFR